jgi:methionyl-tRNA synthetase
MESAIEAIAPHDALKAAWSFVRKANAYVEEVTPWVLAKDEAQRRRLEVVLYELVDALRLLALMTAPIMPRSAQELWARLGLGGSIEECTYPKDLEWGLVPAGNSVTVGEPLFPRIDDKA